MNEGRMEKLTCIIFKYGFLILTRLKLVRYEL